MGRVKEAVKPLDDEMERIEKDLMTAMNQLGVDSVKTEAGTPYKQTSRSVKMKDAGRFKSYVFAPAVAAISSMANLGEDIVANALLSNVDWDKIDFRAGKSGIVEHFEATGEVVPGVAFDQFTVVNIRKN